MSPGVEYILKARDLLSGVLRNASKAAEHVSKTVNTAGKDTENAMRSAERSVSRASRSWKNYIDNVRKSNTETNQLAGSIKRVVSALALIQGTKSILKLGAALETSRINFNVLLGNQEKARIMLANIIELANKTPYENEGLIENAKLMLSFGTSAEKILPNLRMIGDIAMGDANKMSSLTLAFSQMSSAGRLMGQDLLQMINAGFNPLQEISKMTGKSIATLKTEMEKGKISVTMVEEAFKHATSEGGTFFQMMDKMSLTTSGRFSTLVGSLKQAGAEIGLKLLPYANSLLDIVMPLAGWISENADMLIQLTGVLAGAFVAFKLVTFGVKMWTIAQAILNGTMLLNPIGFIIGAIAALISVVIILWNKFAGFRGVVLGVWETFKLFADFLKDIVLNVVKGIADTFTGLGKIIKGVFSGSWDTVKEGAKQAASGYIKGLGGGGVVKAASDFGNNVGTAWKTGYQKGAAINTRNASGGITPNEFGLSTNNNTGGAGGTNTDPSGKISSIATGGSKPTNITINLNREMVGSITINPLTMTQGVDDIKSMLMNALAQILNSGNRLG